MRAAEERRLDSLDEQITAAWHGALWGGVQRAKKLPELKDALVKRRRIEAKQRTFEEDVRRWEIFFKQTGFSKAN